MAKTRIIVYRSILQLIFLLICGVSSLFNSKKKIIRLKIGIGTLILALNANMSKGQDTIPKSIIIQEKNDTIKFNIVLENADVEIEEVVVTCYLGGYPKDRKPYFMGTNYNIDNYIRKELKYPIDAKKNKIEGVVELSYIIEKTGEIGEVIVLKGIGFGCDEEAVRIMKSLPRFNYGIKNGHPAEYELAIKIEFKLNKN